MERPLKDENGQPVLKKGKPQPDTTLRDTENVPLKEDIQTYFEREVLPFAPDAWIDEKKSKVGYEIPFTRYFTSMKLPSPRWRSCRRSCPLKRSWTALWRRCLEHEGDERQRD